MAQKINWLLLWKPLKWPGLGKEKLQKEKTAYEKKAVTAIEKQLKTKVYKDDKAINPKAKIRKYSPLKWRQVNGKPGYYKLYTYLTPPVKPMPKPKPGPGELTSATSSGKTPITPPQPPQP